MTFHVGQRVVCIANPVKRVNDRGLKGYEKGRIYTITHFDLIEPFGEFIGVAELHPRALGHVSGFRPIADRKTDISIFTKMLTGKRVDA